jgi:large subunit ribosomal protein L25
VPEVKIKAEPRTEFGKGAARRIRRADKVPAVLYGHGGDPVHLTLPGYDIMMALKNANALLSIEIDGKSQLALPKQVQRETLRGFIEHVDLITVRRGEKVYVDIPVHVVGDAGSAALVVTEHSTIEMQVEATHIPEYVEVSVDGLDVGDHILAKDITLPQGAELHVDEETLIVNVTAAPTAEEVEAELEEAESEAGIEREEHDETAEEMAAAPAEQGGEAEGGEESSSQE